MLNPYLIRVCLQRALPEGLLNGPAVWVWGDQLLAQLEDGAVLRGGKVETINEIRILIFPWTEFLIVYRRMFLPFHKSLLWTLFQRAFVISLNLIRLQAKKSVGIHHFPEISLMLCFFQEKTFRKCLIHPLEFFFAYLFMRRDDLPGRRSSPPVWRRRRSRTRRKTCCLSTRDTRFPLLKYTRARDVFSPVVFLSSPCMDRPPPSAAASGMGLTKKRKWGRRTPKKKRGERGTRAKCLLK